MLKALEDGDVPVEYGTTIGPFAVYEILCQDFGLQCEYTDTFTRHLRELTTYVVDCSDRSKNDEDAYNNFLANHPRSEFDSMGRPRWEGSEAERLMKADMADGTHKTFSAPKLFYESRDEYQQFSLTVFRGHIDQEIRLQNYFSFLKDKEEKLAKSTAKARETAQKKLEAFKKKEAEKKKKEAEKKKKEAAKEATKKKRTSTRRR
eukprot:Sro462_g148020.1 n/a (205) ;mRNA; r:49942-50556